jgi:hypothetical protein
VPSGGPAAGPAGTQTSAGALASIDDEIAEVLPIRQIASVTVIIPVGGALVFFLNDRMRAQQYRPTFFV